MNRLDFEWRCLVLRLLLTLLSKHEGIHHTAAIRDEVHAWRERAGQVVDASGPLWDDPELDGTEGAHPAYWRGQESGCDGMARHWRDALDGVDCGGAMAHPLGQHCRERTLAMVRQARSLSASVKTWLRRLW